VGLGARRGGRYGTQVLWNRIRAQAMPRGAEDWAEGKTPKVLNADVRATSSVVHIIWD
jgi:hypothetical protein